MIEQSKDKLESKTVYDTMHREYRVLIGFAMLVALPLILAEPPQASLFLQYSWKITSKTSTYISETDPYASEEHIREFLDCAVTVSVTSKKDSTAKDTLNVLELLVNRKNDISSLSFIGDSTITPTLFSDFTFFKNLTSLTVKTTQPSAIAINEDLSVLSACTRLEVLIIDIHPANTLPGPITLTLPKLRTFTFKNSTFTHSITLLNCSSINSVTVTAPGASLVDVILQNRSAPAAPITMRITNGKQKSLPMITSYHEMAYLEVVPDKESFELQEYTIATKYKFYPGADALMNKIVSENINQKKTTLLCCTNTPFTTWKAYTQHVSEKHKNEAYTLATTGEAIKSHRLSIPMPPLSSPNFYTPRLLDSEVLQIAEFLNKVKIKGLHVKTGNFLFKLDKHNEKEAVSVEEWLIILDAVSILQIVSIPAPLPMPKCFYKLYNLTTLSLEHCNIPNLFEIIVAMPGLKEVTVNTCIFTHANTKALNIYLNNCTFYSPSRKFTFINCQSEEDIRLFHMTMLFFCLILGIFLCILYMAAMYTKHNLQLRASNLATSIEGEEKPNSRQ